MKQYRIILADDHAILRRGIRRIIDDGNDLKVIAEVGDGLELLEALNGITPDMVIADISMPKVRGIEATLEIKKRCPGVKVLILSMHKSKEYLIQALTAGADGYLLKEDTDEELFKAIQTVRRGSIYLSPNMEKEITRPYLEALKRGRGSVEDPLSPREKEILKLIVEGYTANDISEMLYISPRTVQHHRARLQRKLGIRKMTELVKYAMDKGFIDSPE